jgi:hypothetical protein
VATWTGTLARSSFWAAFHRVWPHDDHARLVHYDGLAEAELLDRGCDRGDGVVIAAGFWSYGMTRSIVQS